MIFPQLNERLAALEAQGPADLSPMASDLEALKAEIGKLATLTDENSSQLKTLNDQSTQMESTIASVKASETVARSVAINALGSGRLRMTIR